MSVQQDDFSSHYTKDAHVRMSPQNENNKQMSSFIWAKHIALLSEFALTLFRELNRRPM